MRVRIRVRVRVRVRHASISPLSSKASPPASGGSAHLGLG